jgi:hypothetical protein
MTVTVSAWFGVALVLSACFWLGVWARPRLATLRRRIGGSLGRAPASGRGKAGTVERVRTYTECWTAGQRRADTVTPELPPGWSKISAPLLFTVITGGSRGEDKPRAAAGTKRQAFERVFLELAPLANAGDRYAQSALRILLKGAANAANAN